MIESNNKILERHPSPSKAALGDCPQHRPEIYRNLTDFEDLKIASLNYEI